MSKVGLFFKEIRVEHTLFALPFAYVGAVFAAGEIPPWASLFWITLAVLGARTAAMAANRYFDREIDSRNPRTARRALATGALEPSVMLWAIGVGLALLLFSAWMLNPLCVKLMPVAAVGVLFYPLCKRFTWGTHFVLGAVDAMAPLGAYIGIAGTVHAPAFLLFIAVTVWVAGFDIIYALMDLPIDREQGIASVPSRFGEGVGRRLPAVLHGTMAVALLMAGSLAHLSWWYYLGIVFAVALMIYEEQQFSRAGNVFVLNDRIFLSNMAFSVAFLATTILGFALP
ncbi:MAG: putative 4-hydroxybenzoate polyprenyltransferase [Vulcanimicrobiaceae bacterium]